MAPKRSECELYGADFQLEPSGGKPLRATNEKCVFEYPEAVDLESTTGQPRVMQTSIIIDRRSNVIIERKAHAALGPHKSQRQEALHRYLRSPRLGHFNSHLNVSLHVADYTDVQSVYHDPAFCCDLLAGRNSLGPKYVA